jgi:hypothetical protein
MPEITYTALNHTTVVGSVPHGLEALMGTVLAHGAHPDAVLHLDAPDLERLEELGDGAAILCAQGGA